MTTDTNDSYLKQNWYEIEINLEGQNWFEIKKKNKNLAKFLVTIRQDPSVSIV